MYKKKTIFTVITTVLFVTNLANINNVNFNHSQTVQAATKKLGTLKVKGTKKVRLYNFSGKATKYYAAPNKEYSYTAKKYLKIGKTKHLAYKIGDNSHWILAKNASLVKKTIYKKAKIVMPKGYTRASLLKAYQGKPSKAFINACIKGMNSNNFSRTSQSESKKDNLTKINPAKLTKAQTKELGEYSVRLINDARKALGLKPWIYNANVEKLAQDIATEYTTNKHGINNGDHYVAGIVRACKKNGFNLNDNYVEDMAGFATANKTMTMTEMKKNIYFGLKQMIFGYTGPTELQRNDRQFYREWEHAGDLFNTQGSKHDGDYNYYGFSISKNGNVYSMHYISVPTFIINSSEYNQSFEL